MKTSLNPIQPFFLTKTDKYFKINQENSPVVHYYSFCNCFHLSQPVIAVPDGCVDMLFSLGKHEAIGHIYGSVTQTTLLDIVRHGEECFGVRFRPGIVPKLLNISIPELINRRVSICDFKGGSELLERIFLACSFAERVREIDTFISEKWYTHDLLNVMMGVISERRGNVKISELAEITHYSERYISRVFSDYLGLTPKTFSKIMRFQSAIIDINKSDNHTIMTNIAVDSGYHDQPHFCKEFKDFTSMTPSEYIQAIDLPNYHNKIVLL